VRILASTTAGTGHFLPMRSVLAACRDAGHDVVVACPESFASAAASAGLEVAAFDDPAREEWSRIMGRLPGLHPDEANRIVVGEVFGRIDTAAALPRLAATFERWQPDVVVRDPSEYASSVVAHRTGVPAVRVAIGLLCRETEWARAAAATLSDVPGVNGAACDAALLAGGYALAAAPAPFDPPDEGAHVTVHRFREAVAPVDERLPLPPGDTPLIYVTFGTVAASLGVWPGMYRAVVDGLADLPVRVLVTTGADVDADDLGRLPDSVVVSRFVPQDAVLRETAVMVTHAGFGTVLGALRAGVPMVAVPLFAHQFYNAARIMDVGAGRTVSTSYDPGHVPPGLPTEVRDAVLQLLKDGDAKAVSRELSASMAAHPPVGSLVPVLEDLAGGPRRRSRGNPR
jgi:UDP:flavonoid glycosyltransferase YjiC (YdhE family)